jgi:hypothetical protein
LFRKLPVWLEIPLLERGDTTHAETWRPMSLTCILGPTERLDVHLLESVQMNPCCLGLVWKTPDLCINTVVLVTLPPI